MTQSLEEALAEVRKLPESEQDAIAALILDELEDERLRARCDGVKERMTEANRFADVVWAGDLPTVETMIVAGADVNTPAGKGRQPPLHLAIEQQWAKIVRLLIAAGARVDEDLGQGWTPLVHAIDIESDAAWQAHRETGHESTELTEMLLEAGAQPSLRAFEVAERYGNRKAISLLDRYRTAL